MQNKFDLTQEETELLKFLKNETISWNGKGIECQLEDENTGNTWILKNENLYNFINNIINEDVQIPIRIILKELDLFREVSEIKKLTGLKNGYGLEIGGAKIDSNEIFTVRIIRSGDKLKCTVADFLGVEKHFEKFLKSLGFLFEIKSEEAKN